MSAATLDPVVHEEGLTPSMFGPTRICFPTTKCPWKSEAFSPSSGVGYVGCMGFSTAIGLFIFAAYTSPIFAAIIGLLGLVRRMRGSPWKPALAQSVFDVSAIASLVPVVIVTLINPGGVESTVQPVPFTDMWAMGVTPTSLYQNLGNVLVFVPFGALLPLAFGGYFAGPGRIVGVAAVVSIGIEALQFLLNVGRVSSTDDVIVNVLGALAGCALTWYWWRPPRAEGSSFSRGSTTGSSSTRRGEQG
ncbi:VanZ family protein [Nocardiopsis changdeensis]|nr:MULTISPECIES: VanZ family protein [Nocardiopsis]